MSTPQAVQPIFNPEKAHRKQAFWQIFVPAFLGAAIFIGLCVWAVLYTIGYLPELQLADQQSPAAKTAVIWILLPGCFGSLIQLALVGGLVFLLSKLIRGTPAGFHKLLELTQRASALLLKVSTLAVSPLVAMAGLISGLRRFFSLMAFWKHTD